MKTLNTLLKAASIIVLLLTFSTTLIQLNAQESDELRKEVKIKMIKDVNGKETVIDTTFEISSLDDIEGLAEMDVLIGDELTKNLEIKLNDLDENGEINVQVMSFDTEGVDETYKVIVTNEIDEDLGEDGETIKTIDLMVEVADSLNNSKVITLQMEGDEQAVFIADDEKMKTIKTEDGEKTIVIKHQGEFDNENIIVMDGDAVNWHEKTGTNLHVEKTEDGNKITITNESGEVKEYLVKHGEGTYMIGDDGKLTKVEDDKDIIWNEEGDNIWVDIESNDDGDIIIVKSTDDEENAEGLAKTYNVFVSEGDNDEEKEVFVNVVEKKEGDKTVVIKTKVIIESPDDTDKEVLEKAGVNLSPQSDDDELKVDNLKFSPNPSNGKFKLKFKTPEEGNTTIKIYDINGIEVYSESLKNFKGNYDKEIDITGEKSGTYFLKVTQGTNMLCRKIVIE